MVMHAALNPARYQYGVWTLKPGILVPGSPLRQGMASCEWELPTGPESTVCFRAGSGPEIALTKDGAVVLFRARPNLEHSSPLAHLSGNHGRGHLIMVEFARKVGDRSWQDYLAGHGLEQGIHPVPDSGACIVRQGSPEHYGFVWLEPGAECFVVIDGGCLARLIYDPAQRPIPYLCARGYTLSLVRSRLADGKRPALYRAA